MNRPLALLTVASALLAAPPAHAKTHQPKVMVLDLTHDASLSPAAAATLNATVAGAVQNQGFSVITPSQVGAVLGMERQRQLLGCSESGCLAEIGGALGVDFIVQGSLAQLSRHTVLTLTLIDGQKGVSMGSQQRSVASNEADDLIPAIQELVPKLMRAAKPGANLTSPPATSENNPAGGLTGGETSQEASSGHPTGAYVLIGTGVALLAGAVVTGLMASSKASAFHTDQANADFIDAKSAQSSANTLALVSTIATGAGVAAAGGGLIWYFGGSSDSGGAQ